MCLFRAFGDQITKIFADRKNLWPTMRGLTKPPKKLSLNLPCTLPVESSIAFLNLVLAVLEWAVGRFKNVNRRLYKESRAKLKYAP